MDDRANRDGRKKRREKKEWAKGDQKMSGRRKGNTRIERKTDRRCALAERETGVGGKQEENVEHQ
jgi:hypothetical protein